MKWTIYSVLLFVAGCGGTTVQTNSSAYPGETQQETTTSQEIIAFVGDSLFANWKPGPPADAAIALIDEVPQSVSFAVVGQTTHMMRAHFDEVLAAHPTIVVILGGANDVRTEESPATDDLAWMAEQAAASGARVVLGTVPLGNWWDVSTILTQATTQTAIEAWNAQVRALADVYGYTVADFYTQLLNSAGTGPNETLFYGPDYIEPGSQGYAVMWTILGTALSEVESH